MKKSNFILLGLLIMFTFFSGVFYQYNLDKIGDGCIISIIAIVFGMAFNYRG